MDINEIKQVPIVDFLYILGIEPVKHKASGLWIYHMVQLVPLVLLIKVSLK
jgi:hypothetical protein